MTNEVLSRLNQNQNDIKDTISQTCQQMNQRISSVQEMLLIQSDLSQESRTNQIDSFYRESGLHIQPPPRTAEKKSESFKTARSEGVNARVASYAATFRPGCHCACHLHRKPVTPALVNRVLGQLFVGYADLPIFSPGCNIKTCERSQVPPVSVEY